jgi:glucose/arabinose dehydrogenase
VTDLPESAAFSTVHLALSGDRLFAADDADNRVYVIDLGASDPVAEPFAGVAQAFPPGTGGDGGGALAADLAGPAGIAADSAGKLVITEHASGRVRVVGTSDIRPHAFPNRVRLGSGAAVPVAIEGNPAFDATRLVPGSVTVAGLAPLTTAIADVNGDRRADLVVTGREGDLARRLGAAASEAAIRGRLRDGSAFRDADCVTVVG